MSRLTRFKNILNESRKLTRTLRAARSLDYKVWNRPLTPAVLREYTYRPGVYGFSGVPEAREAARLAENARINEAVHQAINRGVSSKVARTKITNLIKKVRKKTGKTYYQRMEVAKLQQIASSKPLTAKKYIKGVDFSYSIYR